MIKKESVYKIGKIGKPHGVDGEVSFHFDDDIFDRVVADYLILEIDGILVPFFLDEYRFKNDETALVLMPGLAFDPEGHRCGYGGGFYDKYLAAHPKHVTLALCYAFQMLDHLDTDKFDIPVQYVISAPVGEEEV